MAKSTFSKHLLDMKFMQKSKEKLDEEAAKAEERKLFKAEKLAKEADSTKTAQEEFVIELSRSRCMDLLGGRLSFKGQNPYIEALMHNWEVNRPEYKKMGGITDEEMTERYTGLVGSMAKKFAPKRQRESLEPLMVPTQKKKSRGFKRPRDD